MSTKPAEAAPAPPKSKKLLVIVVALVLVLVLAGVGAFVYFSKQRAAAAFDDPEQPQAAAHHVPAGPPVYLPLDNMVVNLADPGGERVAQVGITFELRDAAASETVKQYLPTIRSGILLLVSQKTSEELLQRQGKEKLASDILREAGRPFGAIDGEELADQVAKPGKSTKSPTRVRAGDLPVQRVLFSSFIVQ
ncbi:MAG: flagellar basal body-associated FliL family protein [Burkholderiaceae bacterium]